MDGKTYGSLNYEEYMGDSSNHVKDGAIGIPEQMQRLAKEKKCGCCQSTDLVHTDNNGDSETIVCSDCGYIWHE